MNLVVREALLAFKRAPLLSALSVTTIAFSLFVLGLFGLVAVNLQDALRSVAERVEVVAYLLPGTPIEATAIGLKDIEAFPEVQTATYVSEDQAWRGPAPSWSSSGTYCASSSATRCPRRSRSSSNRRSATPTT